MGEILWNIFFTYSTIVYPTKASSLIISRNGAPRWCKLDSLNKFNFRIIIEQAQNYQTCNKQKISTVIRSQEHGGDAPAKWLLACNCCLAGTRLWLQGWRWLGSKLLLGQSKSLQNVSVMLAARMSQQAKMDQGDSQWTCLSWNGLCPSRSCAWPRFHIIVSWTGWE